LVVKGYSLAPDAERPVTIYFSLLRTGFVALATPEYFFYL
jgi:hypothetical protein